MRTLPTTLTRVRIRHNTNNMTYSLSSLSNVTECDILINKITNEKGDLEFRQLSLTRQRESYDLSAGDVSSELITTNGALAGVNAAIAAMTAGEDQNDLISKKLKLESKKFDLENRADDYSAKAKIEKEYSIAMTNKSLDETNALLSSLQTRRAELAA